LSPRGYLKNDHKKQKFRLHSLRLSPTPFRPVTNAITLAFEAPALPFVDRLNRAEPAVAARGRAPASGPTEAGWTFGTRKKSPVRLPAARFFELRCGKAYPEARECENGARPAEMPGFIKRQLATLKSRAPIGDQWIKHDGYRIQIHPKNGKRNRAR